MKSRLKDSDPTYSPVVWEEMLATPLCPLWLCFSRRGLLSLSFYHPGQEVGPLWPVGRNEEELGARLAQWRQETAASLKAYFDGDPGSFARLTLDLQGTPFQIKVWEALRQVPFGSITTYRALAQSLDMPQGARAVGGALKANPLPIIIPCHRVVASNGALGGYSAGLHYKRQLLSHEKVVAGQDPIPLQGPLDRP